MQFLWINAITKQVNDGLTISELCNNSQNLTMDGAVAELNGVFGPKINKTFTELFFVISGKLTIEENGQIYELKERDMYIISPGIKHTLHGVDCTVFISCTPPFNPNQIEFLKY